MKTFKIRGWEVRVLEEHELGIQHRAPWYESATCGLCGVRIGQEHHDAFTLTDVCTHSKCGGECDQYFHGKCLIKFIQSKSPSSGPSEEDLQDYDALFDECDKSLMRE